MKKQLKLISNLYLSVFVFWALYRLIFRLPDEIEELILKPLLWLGPTLYIVFKIEKRKLTSLGYSTKNFKSDIGKGLLCGLLFVLVGLSLNYIKYGRFSLASLPSREFFLTALIVSLVTAISEETVFRGYIMNRLAEILKSSSAANLIASIGFTTMHLPIIVFVYHYNLPQAFIYLLLIFLSSLGSGILFSWTKTIWASILIHIFWSWPIFLLG